jgi:hypothetical protein
MGVDTGASLVAGGIQDVSDIYSNKLSLVRAINSQYYRAVQQYTFPLTRLDST